MNNFCIKTTTGPKQHRGVQVSVSHDKREKAFVASSYPYTGGGLSQPILINLSDIHFANRVILAPAKINNIKQRKNVGGDRREPA
jgi:hypothetical protein